MAVFDEYSKYYDLLYKDKNYVAEADYIAEILGNVKEIFEMGCGTGKHASLLNKKDYNVFGIDLSQTMLEEAKKLGVNCDLGDVRTYRVGKTFDAVISLFHIASYQTTDEDILNYFRTACVHLKKGGKFIFDIWYKPAVLAQVPEKRVKELENDEIKVIRHCVPNHIKEKNMVEVNYDIEIINKKTNEKQNLKEVHPMRYFSEDEIMSIAEKIGFKIVKSEEWLTKSTPSEKTWGVCYVGVKR